MTIKTVGFIISGVFVFAFFVTAPAVLIYFVATHEASVDPIISKIGIVACAHPENFTECSEGVMKLARETLEVREERINRWLYGIAGFLGLVTWIFTALAILFGLGGVFGLWQFRNLKEEAKSKVEELDMSLKEAREFHREIKEAHNDIENMKNNARAMRDNIRDEAEEFTVYLSKAKQELNEFKEVVFRKQDEVQKQANVVNELAKEAHKIVARFDMIDKSMDDIIDSEKTARGLETEMREILNSLKNSTPKK